MSSTKYVKPVLLNMPSDILEIMNDYSDRDRRPRTKLIMDALVEWIARRRSEASRSEQPRGWLNPHMSSGTGIA
jgi:metal-responsive CopG/Arc/MetJ family transcriptional regulator